MKWKWYSYLLQDGKFVTFNQWRDFFIEERQQLIRDGIHVEDPEKFWCWCLPDDQIKHFSPTRIEHKF